MRAVIGAAALPAAEQPAEALEARVWRALRGVHDPEIPVLDVVEMGIVRGVEVRENEPGEGEAPDAGSARRRTVRVILTPTFSACPAIHEIERCVRQAVSEAVNEASAEVAAGGPAGVGVEVVTRLWPPWSSDDMTEAARAKLERFGIAPAPPHGGLIELALDAPVRCPRCGHPDTRLRNPFGSALCREIRTCRACDETFERFKPL